MLSSAVMKSERHSVALLSALALIIPALLHAQENANPQRADPQRAIVERADEVAKQFEDERITDPTVFVKSAALGLLTGTGLAKLAESKSTQADIRTSAGRALQRYQATRAELAAIAKRKHLDVPTSLVYEDEQMLGQGEEKSGAEFDVWYSDQMAMEQDREIALFRAATTMSDTDFSGLKPMGLAVCLVSRAGGVLARICPGSRSASSACAR